MFRVSRIEPASGEVKESHVNVPPTSFEDKRILVFRVSAFNAAAEYDFVAVIFGLMPEFVVCLTESVECRRIFRLKRTRHYSRKIFVHAGEQCRFPTT